MLVGYPWRRKKRCHTCFTDGLYMYVCLRGERMALVSYMYVIKLSIMLLLSDVSMQFD